MEIVEKKKEKEFSTKDAFEGNTEHHSEETTKLNE